MDDGITPLWGVSPTAKGEHHKDDGGRFEREGGHQGEPALAAFCRKYLHSFESSFAKGVVFENVRARTGGVTIERGRLD